MLLPAVPGLHGSLDSVLVCVSRYLCLDFVCLQGTCIEMCIGVFCPLCVKELFVERQTIDCQFGTFV